MSESFENDRRSSGSIDFSFTISMVAMNNSRKFYNVTQSASETLSSTIFVDRFPPYVLTV